MSGIVAKLRGGRSVAAQGRLSLDREKAREKLRKFRLPDPHYYVLQFVRAAATLRATSIMFTIDSDEMRCQFDRSIPPEMLEDLWGVAFEEREGADAIAAHHLALGLGSAQALNPALITVDSSGLHLRLEGERETVEPRSAKAGFTHIYLKEKFRFGHLVEFFTAMDGAFPEVKALREYCQYSAGEIRCNGVALNKPLSNFQFQGSFRTETARGFAALDPIAQDTRFHFLRDNVKAMSMIAPNHAIAGVVVADCAGLKSDLSGMSLIKDEVFDRVLNEVMYDRYHEALLRWGESRESTSPDKRNLAAEIFDYVGLLNKAGRAMPPNTRAVYEFVLSLRIFGQATATGPGRRLSVADARVNGEVCFSREVFPRLEFEQPVLFVPDTVGVGVSSLLDALNQEGVISALKRLGTPKVRDVTMSLRVQQQAERNRAIWQAQPFGAFPKHQIQRRVSVGDSLGSIFLPQLQLGRPGAAKCSLHVEGRLIRHRELTTEYGLAIDGKFQPNVTFDDLGRGDTFGKLAVLLCHAALPLHQDYARELIEAGVDSSERPRLLDKFVVSLLRGRLCANIFRGLGYSPEETLALEERSEAQLAEVLWFSRAHYPGELLEGLGSIADVPWLQMVGGESLSLREAVARPGISILEPVGNWGGVSQAKRDLPEEMLSNVVVVDAAQKEILHKLRPGIRDAREVLQQELARKEFESRAAFIFVDRLESRSVWASDTFSAHGADVELQLIDGVQLACRLLFLWKGRLLGERVADVPLGSFRAIVECDQFQPAVDYTDVVDDTRVLALIAECRHRSHTLLGRWWNRPRSGSDALSKSSEEWELYVEFAFKLSEQQPSRAVIPVLLHSEGQWREWDISLDALRSQIAEQGNVLHYTRGRTADATLLSDPDTAVLPVSKLGLGVIRRWFGSKTKLVLATKSSSVGFKARERFLEKPELKPDVRGKAVRWRGRIRGLDVQTAMFSDPTYGEGKQHNKVSARYMEREVEVIDLVVPFGQFRSVISGDALGPDPTHKFISEGRAELLHAAMEGAAATIREVCRQFSAGVESAILQGLRDDLIRYIPMVRELDPAPPFDLGELLESTRVFETTDGTRLSLRELGLISRNGVVPYGEEQRSSTILRLEASAVAPLERALPEALFLAPASELGLALEVLPTAEPVVRELLPVEPPVDPAPEPTVVPVAESDALRSSDPLLHAVAEMLVAAREKRQDLFDNGMAGSLCWAKLDHGQLCEVSAGRLAIDPDHPLAQRVIATNDAGATAFLASAVYSAVNAYYAQITDPDELEFQGRLLRSRRD